MAKPQDDDAAEPAVDKSAEPDEEATPSEETVDVPDEAPAEKAELTEEEMNAQWFAMVAAMTPEELEADRARMAEEVAAAKEAELQQHLDYLNSLEGETPTSNLPHVPEPDGD